MGRCDCDQGVSALFGGLKPVGRAGSHTTAGTGHRLRYTPGLDGLRAVAILGVVAFHVGFGWTPGGFYGVDTFFVLSGYLITSLLVVEWDGSRTIKLRSFWARRARRLLPALFVLVAGLAVLHLTVPNLLPWPDAIPDALATLGYAANWHFIAGSTNYFAISVSPSPLLHTWSLAIEEQFYMLWPLVVLFVLGTSGRWARRAGKVPDRRKRLLVLLGMSVIGAVASAMWMWHLTPAGASITRAYYGTDTRAQALLIGASIAIAMQLSKLRGDPASTARNVRAATFCGVAGAAGLAAVWYLVPETSTLAFHGGFTLASLASGAILTSVVLDPAGPVPRALALRPVRYIGSISYGAYLWYWPVLLVITHRWPGLGSWQLFALESMTTFGLAALSAKFVEKPIRRGTITSWRAVVGAPVAAAVSLTLVAISAAVGLPALTPAAAGAVKPSQQIKIETAAKSVHNGPPVRVLLVGDSMAGTLGATLAPYAAEYDVQMINEGHPGCGLASDTRYQFTLYVEPPGAPCELGNPNALIDQWKRWVDEYRPNVVVYISRADTLNQDRGSWTWIGNPAYDTFLSDQLRAGVSVLSSEGAKVVLLSTPYFDSMVQTGGAMLPEDNPERVNLDNQLISQIAKGSKNVSMFGFGQLVTPGGRYNQTVDGVDVRCEDGVHMSVAAGQIVAPDLLPYLVRLGRQANVTPNTDPPAAPAMVPTWYSRLPCGEP
ncbi:MAG: acyltransferase family protein [Acidimicrobiales bacterium]